MPLPCYVLYELSLCCVRALDDLTVLLQTSHICDLHWPVTTHVLMS